MDRGYSSQSAFSAIFKRHFGVSPSAFYAWRRRYRAAIPAMKHTHAAADATVRT